MRQVSEAHRSEQRERDAEQDAQRQAPAFVQRGENQKNEDHRIEEYDSRAAVVGFLVRHVAPCVAHVVRKHLVGDFREGGPRFVGRVFRRRQSRHSGRAVEVEAVRELRPGRVAHRDEGRQRDAFTPVVRQIELADLRFVQPVLAFGLDIGLVHPAETVEVVDVHAAEIGRHLRMQFVQRNSRAQYFVVVDRDRLLRHVGLEHRADAGDFGALLGLFDEFSGVFGQVLRRVAALVLDHDRKARTRSQAGNRRRSERKDFGSVDLFVKFHVQRFGDLRCGHLAFVPVFQPDKYQTAIRRLRAGQQAESGGRGDRLDIVVFVENVVDLLDDRFGARQRSGVGQLDVGNQVALVFVR